MAKKDAHIAILASCSLLPVAARSHMLSEPPCTLLRHTKAGSCTSDSCLLHA